MYIRCNILYCLSRSFGNRCSSVTIVTRRPENLFTISGWGGDLCICHRFQPFSVVHPPSYETGSGISFSGVLLPSYGKGTGSSFSGVHPPSYGKGTGSCLELIHPPMEWALEAVGGPSTLLWMGIGSSLSGVHPPSFGWALEALFLGPIYEI